MILYLHLLISQSSSYCLLTSSPPYLPWGITLFRLAVSDDFEVAILISGDTDLVPAIEAIKKTFPDKQIGVVVPIGRKAKELVDVCDFHMKMKEKHLRTSQFPDTIYLDAQKKISLQRPKSWI